MESVLRDSSVPGVPAKTSDETRDGYKIFRKFLQNVILFSGSHRFLDKDLPKLLEIMRVKGGSVVPERLRKKIRERIIVHDDPRLKTDYRLEGQLGFFAFGASAAIQWEQVARLQQLQLLISARHCAGPRAQMNHADGSPNIAKHGFMSMPKGVEGQLVYYFQAVDRFRHPQEIQIHHEALKCVNLSKTAGLMGMFGAYLGMRVRLKKKIAAPELVQEATGEIVGIRFHSKERFGHPNSTCLQPAENHDCWKRGWVRCEYLPVHVEVRFDGLSEDYTGLNKPGVWHVEPVEDAWKLPIRKSYTVDHPNAKGKKTVQVKAKKDTEIEVWRTQCPLAPEFAVTFQGIQGTTVRGPEGQPKGLTLDLYRPQTMRGEGRDAEYFQHVYMALGRAQKLEWMLLRNFPRDTYGELDWSLFEKGPPEFIVEFFEFLETKAKATRPKLMQVQKDLGMPLFKDVPRCEVDPDQKGRYLYDPDAWTKKARESCRQYSTKKSPKTPIVLRGSSKKARGAASRTTPLKKKKNENSATKKRPREVTPKKDRVLEGHDTPRKKTPKHQKTPTSVTNSPQSRISGGGMSEKKPPTKRAPDDNAELPLKQRTVSELVSRSPRTPGSGISQRSSSCKRTPKRQKVSELASRSPRSPGGGTSQLNSPIEQRKVSELVSRSPRTPGGGTSQRSSACKSSPKQHASCKSTPKRSPRTSGGGTSQRNSPIGSTSPATVGRGWWCSLLGMYIGRPIPGLWWFNDPACGAVKDGKQIDLTCGLFAVNHCLAQQGLPIINKSTFEARARDGFYNEGDFDDVGLRNNLSASGCFFELVHGKEHEEMSQLVNEQGLLSMFSGDHVLGVIIHQPNPRHWFALVRPGELRGEEGVALLCDSLETKMYMLSVSEVQQLFETIAARHSRIGGMKVSQHRREELAAEWSCFSVTKSE